MCIPRYFVKCGVADLLSGPLPHQAMLRVSVALSACCGGVAPATACLTERRRQEYEVKAGRK